MEPFPWPRFVGCRWVTLSSWRGYLFNTVCKICNHCSPSWWASCPKGLARSCFCQWKNQFHLGFCCQRNQGWRNRVESVVIENVKTGQVTEQAFGGVFIYVGLDPVSDFVKSCRFETRQVGLRQMITWRQVLQVFLPVGDVRQKDLRQVTTAVGDGAIAGQEAYKYITEHS